jgi:hypothetical protein
MPRRRALLLAFALAACGSSPQGEAAVEPATAAATPQSAGLPERLEPGAWSAYPPAPGAEWPTTPLDDARWAQTTAELACSDRAHQGDPDAQEDGAQRILAHHGTTAAAVMDYGVAVNADAERAPRLGELVAAAVENCS